MGRHSDYIWCTKCGQPFDNTKEYEDHFDAGRCIAKEDLRKKISMQCIFCDKEFTNDYQTHLLEHLVNDQKIVIELLTKILNKPYPIRL
jgi:DNA-directed RNA polymerase subunit RPC12/RpoP